jgi:hypothetical protein
MMDVIYFSWDWFFFCKIVVFALTDNIVMPPTIEDYLPINVNFEPHHPVDLTGIYNYEI